MKVVSCFVAVVFAVALSFVAGVVSTKVCPVVKDVLAKCSCECKSCECPVGGCCGKK